MALQTSAIEPARSTHYNHGSWSSDASEDDQQARLQGDMAPELAHHFAAMRTSYGQFRETKSAWDDGKPYSIDRQARAPVAHDGGAMVHTAPGQHELRVDSGFPLERDLDQQLTTMQHYMETFIQSAREFSTNAGRGSGERFLTANDEQFNRSELAGSWIGQQNNDDWSYRFADIEAPREREALPEGVSESKAMDLLPAVATLAEGDSGQVYKAASMSSASPALEPLSEEQPAILLRLYKKIGRLSIQQERYSNLYFEHGEEMVERNLRMDQGLVVEPSDAVFDKRFRRREQKILDKIADLTRQVEILERKCTAAGLPIPEQQQPAPEQLTLTSPEGGEALEKEDIRNSLPPSPGLAARVEGWLAT